MKITLQHLDGARQIIQRCLGLQLGQNLLIIADETTYQVASLLGDAALNLGVSTMIAFIPKNQQKRIPKDYELSNLIQNAAREARAIITCVNSSPECLPFRDRIFENHLNARTRIGHMPGASPALLKLANVDFDTLISDCRRLELALARGKTLEFVSASGAGERFSLHANIGGWDRIPVASNGIIDDGIWGNVPSGETFIAPLEGTAEGVVVINGSIPGRVIGKGEEFFLRFENGKVADIFPMDSPSARLLFEKQIDVAKMQGDTNWANLAEIGIGINPAVGRLNGNMLLDEKCAGTAHIALGANNFMGGTVNSAIHCDMVVRKPSILVDGKAILKAGQMVVDDLDWLDDFQRVDLITSQLSSASRVCRSGGQVEVLDGRLVRILHSEPGRVTRYPIGNLETSKLTAMLWKHLPAENTWTIIDEIIRHSGMGRGRVLKVLHVMHAYAVIKCSDR
jgi:leucyl aminopeptidase (aminopeptidase T)